MINIFGLRNHGEQYRDTRHNAGALVLADFMKTHRFPEPVSSSKYVSDTALGEVMHAPVRVFLPNTYMNNSGVAVKKSGASIEEIIVLHDDIDLPLGTFKISAGRGAGGNNGIASIIEELGTKDFVRVRVGISPRTFLGTIKRPLAENMAKYVLGTFTKGELKKLSDISPKIQEALEVIIIEGKEIAMNKYNT